MVAEWHVMADEYSQVGIIQMMFQSHSTKGVETMEKWCLMFCDADYVALWRVESSLHHQ